MTKLNKNKNVHRISDKYKQKGKNIPFYMTDFFSNWNTYLNLFILKKYLLVELVNIHSLKRKI